MNKNQDAVKTRIEYAKQLLANGKTRTQAAKEAGIAPATLVRWIGRKNRKYKRRNTAQAAPKTTRVAYEDFITLKIPMKTILKALIARGV